jgi:hypothetical protein
LVTTDTSLDFTKTYELYANRWAIEVFFKECKQLLGLGKNQSRDFDAQIADTTISMMQYNTLSLAKRFLDYESIGGIFREAGCETLEFTIVEKIWGYILDILSIVSELFEIDFEEILDKIVSENKEVSKIIKMKAVLDAT